MCNLHIFYLLASRTRIDVVELIVRKKLLLCFLFFFCFGSYILQSNLIFTIKISSKALTKLRSVSFWKLRTAIINRFMRLELIICPKKERISSLSSIKLVPIRNKCYQCKLVCTGTMNEWCKILTIKILTEVNRT